MGIDRRQFIGGAGAALWPIGAGATAALPVPPDGKIGFKVLRNGAPIGEHHLSFSGSGGDVDIAIEADLLVKFAGIAVFSFAARGTEHWRGGVFQGIDSYVNDNGNHLEVHASRAGDGYQVMGTHVPRYTAPADLLPLTYWNRQMMYGTILNIQTAHSYKVPVNSPGWNSLPTADGGSIVAQRFDLSGRLHLSVWYDKDDAWSGLEFHVHGDETYQKMDV